MKSSLKNKKKIRKNIKYLSYPINHLDLIDIYKTFYPMGAEGTLFLNTHGVFIIVCILKKSKSYKGLI